MGELIVWILAMLGFATAFLEDRAFGSACLFGFIIVVQGFVVLT